MDVPSQNPQSQEAPVKRDPKKVFMDYGVASGVLIWWVAWCIRDGWFHPGYSHIGFSQVMAIIFAPILVFCLVMATSAGLTWRRQVKNPAPPQA